MSDLAGSNISSDLAKRNTMSLPPELLLQILAFMPSMAQFKDVRKGKSSWERLGYLTAAQVCPIWRELVLKPPRTLSIGPHEVERTLALLPNNMPLELVIDDMWEKAKAKDAFAAVGLLLSNAADRLVGIELRVFAKNWESRPVADVHSIREMLPRLAFPKLCSIVVKKLSSDSGEVLNMELPVAATARDSLRTLDLRRCTLSANTRLDQYQLQTLVLVDCAVTWKHLLRGDTARFENLHVLRLEGHTLINIGACPELNLRMLKELVLHGDIKDVLLALDRLSVPASASLDLAFTESNLTQAASNQFADHLLDKHYKTARNKGDYFTSVSIDSNKPFGPFLQCSVPNPQAIVLGASTKLEIRLWEQLNLSDCLSRLTSALPLGSASHVSQISR